jgi:two-component system OmpR family response regulator
METKAHILLVEDEVNFGSILCQFLQMHEFQVTWVKNGAEAYSLIKSEKTFDCGVLDVMMPEMDGITLGKEMKAIRPNLPFVFLTAKSQKENVLEGFKTGAADYITKPFDSEILVYKLRALLARNTKEEKPAEIQFEMGEFLFDSALRTLTLNTTERRLSPKESKVLSLLAARKNQLVSREEILNTAWDEDNYFTRRSMDVYMAKLRKYLAADPKVKITSLHAGGYMLEVKDGRK